MFYICDKKDNKYGVLDTTDGIVDYFIADDLQRINKDIAKIFGVFDDGTCEIVSIAEYQEVDLGKYRGFSFVDSAHNHVYFGVENKKTGFILDCISDKTCIVEDGTVYHIFSKHPNGDLKKVINTGRARQCIGLVLDISFKAGIDFIYYYEMCLFIEIDKNGVVTRVSYNRWEQDTLRDYCEYDSETDHIVNLGSLAIS